MKAFRCSVALAALVLLGGLTPLWSQDRVLVPGDPPLTQSLLEKRLKYLEWLLDTHFTARQRSDYQRLFMQAWRNAKPAQRRHWDDYMTRDAEQVDKMGPEESVRQRGRTLPRTVAAWEKSKFPGERWALDQYNALYKPGGPKNPIVVAGDPPLTQRTVDLYTAVMELFLDLGRPLSDAERREYQRMLVQDWKAWDQSMRRGQVKSIETWSRLPGYSNYQRNLARALDGPKAVTGWARSSEELDRWLRGLHEAALKPGSARNPVLVAGEPPLTQLLVDRYGDYLEVMLDLSVSGGFTAPQRQVLKDYLMKGWKTMPAADRDELLGDLKRWSEAAGQDAVAANQSIGALRPKLLAQLGSARDDPRSQWILGVLAHERALIERRKKDLEYVEEMQRIADEMRRYVSPPGRWEYNPSTRRYDRWVPDR